MEENENVIYTHQTLLIQQVSQMVIEISFFPILKMKMRTQKYNEIFLKHTVSISQIHSVCSNQVQCCFTSSLITFEKVISLPNGVFNIGAQRYLI